MPAADLNITSIYAFILILQSFLEYYETRLSIIAFFLLKSKLQKKPACRILG